jgi:TP901 family phage tail tape measure protein
MTAIESIQIYIEAVDRATKPIKNVQKELSKFGSAISGFASMAAKFGAILGGAAIAGAAYKGVQAFMAFEDALANVRKTTGMSKEQVEALGNELDKLSKEMPMSATGLADIAAIAGQLGIQKQKDILDFTKTVAMMGVAFDMSSQEAAVAMAKMAAAFKLPIEKIRNLASSINYLGNTTSASEREIISAMYRIAPAAAQLGIAGDVASAFAATIVATGQAGEEAGTRFNRALVEMSSNLEKIAEQMGKPVEELRKRMDMGDALGVLMDWLKTLKNTESATKRLAMAEDVVGAVGAKAILTLVSNYDNLIKNLEGASKAFVKGTALQEEYANKTDTLSASLRLLRNNVESVMRRIGRAFAPVIREAAKVVEEKILPAVEEFIDWLGKLKKAIEENKHFKAFVGFLKSEVVPKVETLYNWIKKLADMFISPDWAKIGEHIKAGLESAKKFIEEILFGKEETEIIGGVKVTYRTEGLIDKFKEVKDKVVALLSSILPEAFNAFNEFIKQKGQELENIFKEVWSYATDTEAIDKMTDEWADAILNGTATMADLLSKGTKEAEKSGFFDNLIRLFVNLFKVLGVAVYAGIVTIGHLIKNLLVRIYPGIKSKLIDLFAKVGKLFGDALSAIYNNTVVKFFEAFIGAINSIIEKVNEFISVMKTVPIIGEPFKGIERLKKIEIPDLKIDLGSTIEAKIRAIGGEKKPTIENVTLNVNINAQKLDPKLLDEVVMAEFEKRLLRKIAERYTVRRGIV